MKVVRFVVQRLRGGAWGDLAASQAKLRCQLQRGMRQQGCQMFFRWEGTD